MTAKRLLQSFIRTTTIAAMILFMGVGLAQAQSTWYVSSTEGDNNNDGSQMENAGAGVGPFASIGTAITAASDGDTIVVLAGAYNENVTIDESVTLQAVASGINTDVAVTGTLELDDVLGATIASGTGVFSFSGAVTLDAGILTLAAGELELANNVTVTIEDGSMAGSSPTYGANYSLVYNPTNAGNDEADVTAGTELDGDTGTGTIQVAAGYDNGTFTINGDVTSATLDVDGDADVTVNGDFTGNLDEDGGGDITIDGDVTGNVDTAGAGDLSVTGEVAGNVTTAGTGDASFGSIDGATVTLGSTGDESVTGTVTLTGALDHNAGTLTVGGAIDATGVTLDDPATLAAVSSDADVVINAGAADAITMASLTLSGAGSDLTITNGTVTITGGLSVPHIADGVVITHTAGTTEVGSIVLGLTDNDDAVSEIFPSILDVDAGSFTITGAVTETSVESENGGTDIAALEIDLAAGALIVFESSTTVSGDVTNATADFDDTEGIEVGAGATVTLEFAAAAHADLGYWGGEGTLEIAAGAAAISTLAEASNFTLSAARAMNTAFTFTGDVAFEAASAVTITGALFSVGGNLTTSAAVSFDDGGNAADAFVVAGNVTTTGAGAFTFGADATDDIEVTGDVNGNVTSAGTMQVDGDATLTGGTVASTVNFAGDLTIPAEASVTFTDVGEDVSDVEGTLTVNGTLTLTTQGADDNLSVGSVSIGVDGELDLDGTNGLILAGDFTGGTLTDADDIEINIPVGGATFAPAPNTTVANFSISGSGRTVTVSQGFATGGLTVGNDATLALGDNTVTVSDDVTLTDEAAVTNGEFGAIAFAGGDAQGITVAGNPSTDPTLSNIRVNNSSSVTLNQDIFLSGDLALNDGTFTIAAAATLTMTGDDAQITRDPSQGTLTVTGALAGAWDVTYFGAAGSSTGEFADGQTADVTVNMTDGQALALDDVVAITGNLHVEDGLVDVTAAVVVGGNFTNSADADDFDVTASLTVDGNVTLTDTGTDTDFAGVLALTVGGNLTVPTDVVLGGGTVTLTGDNSTHSNEGDITSEIDVSTDITVTINGSTDDTAGGDAGHFGAIDVNAGTVTMNDVQETGAITVNDGTLTVNYVDGDAGAVSGSITMDSAADEAASLTLAGSVDFATGIVVGNISMDGNSTLTLSNDVDAPDVVLGSADTDVIVLDLGDNTLTVDGSTLDAVLTDAGSVSITGSGDIAIKDASDTVIDFHGNTLPSLVNYDDGVSLESDITVGTYVGAHAAAADSDVDLAGHEMTITGDVTLTDEDGFNGAAGSTVIVAGASTWTMAGEVVLTDLTLNAATTFAGEPDVYVNGALTIGENGSLVLSEDTQIQIDDDLIVNSDNPIDNSAFADIYLSQGAEHTDIETNGFALTLGGRVYTDGVVDLTADAEGSVTFTGQLYAGAGTDFQTDDGDGETVNNAVVLGADLTFLVDGSGDFSTPIANGGGAMFRETPTFGGEINYDYRLAGNATTGNELPADGIVGTLNLSGGASVLTIDQEVSTDYLILNGAVVNAGEISVRDGGLVQLSAGEDLDAPFALAGAVGTYYVTGAATQDANNWPATMEVELLDIGDGIAFDLASDTAVGSIDSQGVIDFNTNSLTATGNVVGDAGAEFGTDADGQLVMAGTVAQTLTAPAGAPRHLVIDNEAGVTLGTDTDLDFSRDAAGANAGSITLTAGVLNTAGNSVTIEHNGTGSQGFTRTAGVINGAVQKYVRTDGANPNRVVFPTGDADGNYRPYTITFNDPLGDIGDLETWDAVTDNADILLTATYSGVSATGTNGLPIATTDAAGSALNIGRYPAFHWSVSSNPSVSPSVDYDVEFEAAGYTNFASESIERTRAIRRAAGSANNFWSLVSPTAANNDNYVADVDNTNPVAVARGAVGAVSTNGVLFTYGLEQNMVATAPDALTLNAGNAETIDLTTVFAGGEENPTYTVSGNDGTVATTAIDGATLTVTGVAAGSVTFTVSANDGFQTVSTSVTATVNAALAAAGALADHVVALGTAAAAVDASGDFSGGTGAYTYAVASTDATVAGVTVDAGTVTVTFGVAGTATVTVTATDEEGDSVSSSFDVTVNGSIVAAGGLAAVAVAEGASSTTDVAGEFSGGNGAATYTYAAASSDADIATVAVSGSEVTVTGVSAYTVVDGAVTADNAGATITVTATDDQGTSATSTYTVSVTAVLGNVDGSGGPSPAAASLTLDAFLGLEDLTAQQAAAADYNGDGAVTPFDAALIFDAFFNGKTEFDSNPQAEYFVADIAREGNIVTIPVMIGGDNGSVVSGHFATTIDPSLATVVGVTSDLGEGWLFNSVVTEDGNISLAFASAGGVIQSQGGVASISVELSSADVQFSISAEGAANNNPTMSIDDIEIVELPTEFTLNGNYPNPFNPSTSISFDLPQSADVEIQVIDMIGRQVMTMSPATISAGANRTVQIDASRLASGTYFYRVIARMESRTAIETGRMMLVK